MDKMTVTIAPEFNEALPVRYSSAVEIPNSKNPAGSVSEIKTLSSDQVDISKEASQKSVDEQNQKALLKLTGNESAEETENSREDELNQLIAELQEKIAELSQQIVSVRSKGDEESIEKAQSLESELVLLNAQLMELLHQKMDSAQES